VKEGIGREMAGQFGLRFRLPSKSQGSFTCRKQTALLPLRWKACCGFFRPKNPTASAGFEPANLGRVRLKRDGTRADTRFRLSEKRTGPFESAGVSAYSGASRRSVHIVVVTW
jgi:hypothetical protein